MINYVYNAMIFLKLGPGQLTSVQPLDRSFAPPWCTAQRPELHRFQPPIRGQGRCSLGQCVKTNSTPVVHIKIAGIYGCEYPPKNGINRYWSIPKYLCFILRIRPNRLICGGFWQSHKPYRVKPGSRHPLKKVPGFGSLPSGLGIAIGHIDADHVDARHLGTPWSTHSYNGAEFWSGPRTALMIWANFSMSWPWMWGMIYHILDQRGKMEPMVFVKTVSKRVNIFDLGASDELRRVNRSLSSAIAQNIWTTCVCHLL